MFQSLAVNNNESTGGTHIGAAATSVTVITSSGVVSYQHGGSIPVGRAAGWAVNFDRLLRDKVGLATFTVSSMERDKVGLATFTVSSLKREARRLPQLRVIPSSACVFGTIMPAAVLKTTLW